MGTLRLVNLKRDHVYLNKVIFLPLKTKIISSVQTLQYTLQTVPVPPISHMTCLVWLVAFLHLMNIMNHKFVGWKCLSNISDKNTYLMSSLLAYLSFNGYFSLLTDISLSLRHLLWRVLHFLNNQSAFVYKEQRFTYQ